LLFLPLVFLVGYFVFVTRWVPRILLTLKARAWLTRYDRAAALAGLAASDAWPELVLMAVQFAGLLWVVTRVALVTAPTDGLTPLGWTPPAAVTFSAVGAAPVENFFVLWSRHRTTFLFAPAGASLTAAVDRVLGGFGFFAPGKQFPLLGVALKKVLADESARLSGSTTATAGV
jgi:hypothetical protein